MPRHAIPRVIENRLLPLESSNQNCAPIAVDSEDWYVWLNAPDQGSFAFSSSRGSLTARREKRHGTWYWYAYRSQAGRLSKVYLGKSEELTQERLHEAATLLSAQGANRPEPKDSVHISPSASPPVSSKKASSLHLLTTKISVPPARQNVVTRPRLVQRMNAAMSGMLTLIVAPAGWGKTTLLNAWYTDTRRGAWPMAWVSLDGRDNDPIRFWTYVVAALDTLHLGLGESPLALMYTSPPAPLQDAITSLLNALTRLPTQAVLVLDDYHLIETEDIHEMLTYFVEHLPANVHLVIASRSDPLLPLARLRARGILSELRAADLRFTAEESAAFLTEVMGLPLSAEQVAALQERTEGWIAGLQLAALSLQGRQNVASFIAAFTGSHRYVVDYLVEEVLARQPEEVEDFLVQTCILDRLSGPLCDAVRGRDDSLARIAQVEQANLFLVSLDDERHWYRYHHLFAEVLRSRLGQQQPAMVPQLHYRACRWYEQHKLYDEAVTHALAVPDVELAAHLIEQYAQLTNFPSQFQVLLGWLNRLPDALVRTQPSLCLMHAIMLMLTHQLEEAELRVQDAERCLREEMPAQERRALMSLIAAYRANMARLFGDYERCVPLAQQALELMPETDVISLTRMFRPSTIVTAASAYMVDGDMTPAVERQVEAAVTAVRTLGNVPTTMRSISNLARLQLLQGRPRQAALTIEQMAHLASERGGLHTLLNGADYYFLRGDLLREWNRLEEAEQHLAQGLDMVSETMTADAEMIARGYMALARLQQARGENTQALATLDAYAQVAYPHGFAPVLLAQGAAVRAQVELAQGNLAAALHWVETHDVPGDSDPRYAREQEYLTLVRVHIAQAREQRASHFLEQALGLLERLAQDTEAKSRTRSQLEVLVLRALALSALGDNAGSLSALGHALRLAEPEGYIRLFLDEGAPMITLLHQAHGRNLLPGYAVSILEAAGESGARNFAFPAPHPDSLIEPLTPREHEVLQLLLDGASNREIAQHLVLSVNTVKKHVLNLCGKLGVQSRAQAIARARNLHLL